MRKLTGFVILWIVSFSILWILDENGLFSYRTIEIFFGKQLSLPKKYTIEKINLAQLEQKSVSENEVIESKTEEQVPEEIIDNVIIEEQVVEKEKDIVEVVLGIYKKGNYYECLKQIGEVTKNAAPDQKNALTNLSNRCQKIILLIENVAKKENFDNSVTVIVSAGKEYVGIIISDTAEYIHLKMSWGTVEIDKSRITSQRTISIEQYSKELLKKLEREMVGLSPENKKEVLSFLSKCYEHNMASVISQTISYLELENENILDELIEYKAESLYRSFLWCQTMGANDRAQEFRNKILDKFPQTKAAEEIKKQPVRVEVVEKKNNQEIAVKEKNNKILETLTMANRYYDVAYQHLRKSFPGEPNADQELAKAKENFQKACKYYQETLSLEPDNVEIKKKLQQSMEYYHHCIKQSRLGVW